MELLLNHWHCIMPAIAIFVALFLLRNKDEVSMENKNRKKDCEKDN